MTQPTRGFGDVILSPHEANATANSKSKAYSPKTIEKVMMHGTGVFRIVAGASLVNLMEFNIHSTSTVS